MWSFSFTWNWNENTNNWCLYVFYGVNMFWTTVIWLLWKQSHIICKISHFDELMCGKRLTIIHPGWYKNIGWSYWTHEENLRERFIQFVCIRQSVLSSIPSIIFPGCICITFNNLAKNYPALLHVPALEIFSWGHFLIFHQEELFFYFHKICLFIYS